jgi:hypothetical protein
MGQGRGFKKQVGFGEQIAFETKVAPTAYLEFTNEDLTKKITEILSAGITGSAGVTRRILGAIDASGSLDFELFPEGSMGLILKHAMGAVSTTQPDVGNNPTVYEHEFTLADALPEHGLTIPINRDIGTMDYFGCKINTLELTAAVNAIMTGKIGIIGKDASSGTPMSTVFPDEDPIVFCRIGLKVDTVETEVSNFTLSLNNNLRDDRYGIKNDCTRQQIERKNKREVTGSFNRVYLNDDIYDDFIAGTPAVLELKYVGAIIAGGDDSYSYTFLLEIPIAYYNSFTPGTGGVEMGDHTVPFRILEGAAAKEFKITLTNADSSV